MRGLGDRLTPVQANGARGRWSGTRRERRRERYRRRRCAPRGESHILSTNFSVIDPPFLVGLGLATAVAFAVSWFPLRRAWLKWSIRGLGVTLTILMAASALNARYAYLPTIATLFGRSAIDAVSPCPTRARSRLAGLPGNHVRSKPRTSGSRSRTSPTREALDHGVVVPFDIPATRSRTSTPAQPRCTSRRRTSTLANRRQLPVIELLHGTPGSPVDWTRGGYADITADEYASHHGRFRTRCS